MLRLSANRGVQRTNTVIRTHANHCRATELCSILGPEAWKGRSCFLIGGGPSLEDPSCVATISKLIAGGALTIGVNKSFLFGTTLCYAMDEQFYNLVTTDPDINKDWKAYQGMKIFISRSKQMRLDSTVYSVHSLDRKVLSFDIGQGIYPGNNSGMGAIMLACALGCKKIGLLGYDFSVRAEDGKTHWHAGYKNQEAKEMPKVLNEFKLAIEEFADVWKVNGIDIVNLNSASSLQCFRFVTVDEFCAEKPE